MLQKSSLHPVFIVFHHLSWGEVVAL